jgi:NAD(P)-dependent dehydrogenase (short-subunit alcohol dehydrogenase family)
MRDDAPGERLNTKGIARRSRLYWPVVADRPLRIALHVSNADGWPAAFSSLKNLTAQRPDAKLRVIFDAVVESYGRVGVIINNAGLTSHSPLERLNVDDWERMIGVPRISWTVMASMPCL